MMGNDLLGFLLGTLSMMHAPLMARIYQIAVAKEHQGQAIGYQLLHAFQQSACRNDASCILATVAEDLPCVRWWLRQGYDSIGFGRGGKGRNRRVILFTYELIANAMESPYCRPPAHRPGGRFEAQQSLDL